jgi:Flp pilus assembly protein TadG
MTWRRKGGRAGNVAVEFALIAPVLVTLFMGTVDYGLEVYYDAQLTQAVRAGAEYVNNSGHSQDTAGIEAAVQGASSLTGIAVPAPTASYQCSDGTAVAGSGSTCANGSATGSYMTISATYTYTSFISFFSSTPRTLSSTVTVRYQ